MNWLRWHYHVKDITGAPWRLGRSIILDVVWSSGFSSFHCHFHGTYTFMYTSASSSSMSRSRRGALRRSSSMATADGTPPEIHWWTARVLSNLIYPSSTRTSSRDGTRRTTNWQIDVPACEQEHHSQAKKLSCRRQTKRRLAPLNILINHSKSLSLEMTLLSRACVSP